MIYHDASFLKNLKPLPLTERPASLNQFAENVKIGLLDVLGPALPSEGTEATSSDVPASMCLSPCLAPKSCATKPGIDSNLLPSVLQTTSWADVVQSAEQDASLTSLNSGVVLGGFLDQSDIGGHVGTEKALLEKLGSAVGHPLDQSVEYPTDAASFELLANNQGGFMPPNDYAAETHQLSVPGHVAGPLDLKLHDMESPTLPPPQASEISLLALACPKIEGQQCCNVEEANYSLTVSFAEKLPVGLDPVVSRLPSICSVPVPISDEDRIAALSSLIYLVVGDDSQAGGFAPSFHTASVISEAAKNMMEPAFPGCAMVATDVVSSGLLIEAMSEEDHVARYGHHDMAPDLVADLDLTPDSITCLSSKYSLDASSNVGHDTISPEDSLANVREGQDLDAPKALRTSAGWVCLYEAGQKLWSVLLSFLNFEADCFLDCEGKLLFGKLLEADFCPALLKADAAGLCPAVAGEQLSLRVEMLERM
ncbi:hypothetical protein Nepgr_021069 [Nepenthes gracilis]|uniref:Uncharacterized protein n=1 Tax=Nepenthes gracilis TaxID=150966 RepID=A0AAD3XVT6_NEPGR|nr:hypothetical protein Nepgr_021069 [Nepenthes gracilis]